MIIINSFVIAVILCEKLKWECIYCVKDQADNKDLDLYYLSDSDEVKSGST